MEEPKEEGKILVGDLVMLQGLVKACHLNGRKGVVASDISDDGRFIVTLFPKSEKKEVKVRPSNLMLMRDLLEFRGFGTMRNAPCPNCGDRFDEKELKECSKCLLVAYCSNDCQRKHWKAHHKHQCETFRQARKQRQVPGNVDPGERMEILSRISHRLMDKKDYVGAEKVICDAIEEASPHKPWQLYSLLAYTMDIQGKVDGAVETMQYALQLQDATYAKDLDRAAAYQNLATYLESQGDFEQAVKTREKLFLFDPHPRALFRIGHMHFTLRHLTEAEEAYNRFVQAMGPCDDPNHEDADLMGMEFGNLAIITQFRHSLEGKARDPKVKDEIVEMYQKAIHLDPHNVDTHKHNLDAFLVRANDDSWSYPWCK